MVKVLVVFYSTHGHVYAMAKAVAEGAKQIEGAQVDLRRVKETLSPEILAKMGVDIEKSPYKDVPIIEPKDVGDYDVVLFGTPTRFGNMAAQMKAFIDAMGGLWVSGKTVGKVAGVFTSSNTQHGGQETTITTFHTVLLHLGFIVVGLPYAYAGQCGTALAGCSPYGPSTIAGPNGELKPNEVELEGGRYFGKHATTIGNKLFP